MKDPHLVVGGKEGQTMPPEQVEFGVGMAWLVLAVGTVLLFIVIVAILNALTKTMRGE